MIDTFTLSSRPRNFGRHAAVLEYNYNYTLHTSHYYDVASCDIRRKPYKPLAANSLPVPRCHRALSRAQHVRLRPRRAQRGSAATTGAVPVALTLNGLQFTPELHEFVYQHESADEAQWHGPPPGTAAAR